MRDSAKGGTDWLLLLHFRDDMAVRLRPVLDARLNHSLVETFKYLHGHPQIRVP